MARAEVARAALPDGLRAAGWEVDDVAACRTVTREPTPYCLWWCPSARPRPAAAASYDLAVTVEAAEHTIEGTVAALIAHASSWPS